MLDPLGLLEESENAFELEGTQAVREATVGGEVDGVGSEDQSESDGGSVGDRETPEEEVEEDRTIGDVISECFKDRSSPVMCLANANIAYYARQNEKRAAIVTYAVPDEWVKNIQGDRDRVDVYILARLPKAKFDQLALVSPDPDNVANAGYADSSVTGADGA